MSEAYETVHCTNDALSMHRHDAAFLSLVLAGVYQERSVDGCFEVCAGSVILHPPFHAHSNHFLSDDVTVLNVALPDATQISEAYRVSKIGELSPLECLMRTRPVDIFDRLGDLFRIRCDPVRPKTRWVEDLSSALSLGASEGRIDALASGLGVSAAHASRQFLREFGMSPVTFRREQQLRRALGALERGEPLAGVAVEAGFSDQSHMGRAFKTAFGATPKDVQKRLAALHA